MNIQFHVVLVRTLYTSNIGASSRAMTNMGAHRLILVDPKCEIDYSTQQAAASGQRPLQNRVVYSSWKEFYQNESGGLRIALTARDGRGRDVYDLKSTLEKLIREHDFFTEAQKEVLPIYLFFGPEDCGLSADDISDCHYCCSIPTFGENWSLNLAQAVLLALFISRDVLGGKKTILDGQIRNTGKHLRLDFADETLKTWIQTLGFDLSKRKINAYTVLKRMMLHNVPTQKEARIFEAVVQQTIRKLKEKQD